MLLLTCGVPRGARADTGRLLLARLVGSCLPTVRKDHSPLRYASTGGSSRDDASAAGGLVSGKSPAAKRLSRLVFNNKLTLKDFIAGSVATPTQEPLMIAPYLAEDAVLDACKGKSFYIEVYGCQMNTSDTEILCSILQSAGMQRVSSVDQANVAFLMTCAIREHAEAKIRMRISELRTHRLRLPREERADFKIAVLGCMAERLKERLFEQATGVDIICGPDAYRSLPMLLCMSDRRFSGISGPQQVANVALSADETYADITPVRLNPNSITASVSIMRGCNNMCSFCVVPFTRGIERSRSVESIVESVDQLSSKNVKEVLLLGQNVNSFRDDSDSLRQLLSKQIDLLENPDTQVDLQTASSETPGSSTSDPDLIRGSELSSPGFKTIYRRKAGGRRFTELMERVSKIDPEMRIRFTSAHPKDFPEDLLRLIAETPNICKQVHLPLQAGSSKVLERMRRGYTREAFVELAQKVKNLIPGVVLTTDIIVGFCGETDEDFQETLKVVEEVKFDVAYMYAYSMRENTHAHRNFKDDVPKDVKIKRLVRLVDMQYALVKSKHTKEYVNTVQLCLVEGLTRNSTAAALKSNLAAFSVPASLDRSQRRQQRDAAICEEQPNFVISEAAPQNCAPLSPVKLTMMGRTDGGIATYIDVSDISHEDGSPVKPGDYVAVKIDSATGKGLNGRAICITTLTEYNNKGSMYFTALENGKLKHPNNNDSRSKHLLT